jgi:hydrogenase maturation protease
MRGSSNTLVLGLGNILHSDDGIGPRVVEQLKRDGNVPKDVSLIDGGTLGLELLPYIVDASRLLILDAIDAGQPPGTLIRLSPEELYSLPGSSNVHHLGAADLLTGLRMVAEQMPEVTLLGIQPRSAGWGTDLSPAVEAALPRLAAAVLGDLGAKPDREGEQ